MKSTKKLVRGVGVNDSLSPVSDYVFWYEGGKRKQKCLHKCPAYVCWENMLARCYDAKVQEKHPTYVGCSVSPEWLTFSKFRAWYFLNYQSGWEVDKDLLRPGNREYSPENCRFVPKELNMFLTNTRSAKGYTKRANGKFQVFCSDPLTKKVRAYGTVSSEDDAAELYRIIKFQNLRHLLDKYPGLCPELKLSLYKQFAEE